MRWEDSPLEPDNRRGGGDSSIIAWGFEVWHSAQIVGCWPGGERKSAVTVWDVATGMRLSRFEDKLGKQALAFSLDGKTLACCADHTVIFGGADSTPARTVRLYPINLPVKK